MLVPNPDIDEVALREFVAAEFGRTNNEKLAFRPVGGDSWSYRLGPWWVNVRRDRQGSSAAAFETAFDLKVSGLEWVLAPACGRSGQLVHDFKSWPVVVFPFVEGTPIFPRFASRSQAEAVHQMIDQLHQATSVRALPTESFALPFKDELAAGIERAFAGAVQAGPYGARVTKLVRENAAYLESLRRKMAECQDECRSEATAPVLTHGEPNRGNVMQGHNRLVLMDWGDLAWGPPERDLVQLGDFGVPTDGRPTFRRFYELHWILGEIAEYVARFSGPHAGDAQDEQSWKELLHYLKFR